MSRSIRGILIDPSSKTVTDVQIDGDDFSEITRVIGAKFFSTVRPNENLVLYVDDEGLVTLPPEGRPFFGVHGYMGNDKLPAKCDGFQPLVGNGLILAVDDVGESVSVPEEVTTWDVQLRTHFGESNFTPEDVKSMGPLFTFLTGDDAAKALGLK